jgi:hypothetical protein
MVRADVVPDMTGEIRIVDTLYCVARVTPFAAFAISETGAKRLPEHVARKRNSVKKSARKRASARNPSGATSLVVGRPLDVLDDDRHARRSPNRAVC